MLGVLPMDTHMNETITHLHGLSLNDEILIDATHAAIEAGCGVFVSFTQKAWDELVYVAPGFKEGDGRLRDVLAALRACIHEANGRLGPEPLHFTVLSQRPGTELMDEVGLACNADLSEGGGLSLTISLSEEQ